MLVHTLYPIGATVKNVHTGVIATIKEHGCTSSTDEGVELMLWMEGGQIWKSWNVEVIDTPNTAEVALSHFSAQQRRGIIGFIVSEKVAFECLVNLFMPAVKSISMNHFYTIDFLDGSLITFKQGSWVEHGFYAQIQDRRC